MSHVSPFTTEWELLSRRVTTAVETSVKASTTRISDSFSPAQHFNDALQVVIRDLRNFVNRLPTDSAAAKVIPRDFLNQSDYGAGLAGIQNRCALLLLVQDVLESNLGKDVGIIAAIESAFTLIDRRIAVLETERNLWKSAFSDGETACEELGALRFLESDIWPFKAHATGQRTDLILHAPLPDEASSGRYALVLTEWKIADDRNCNLKIDEAIEQCRLYKGGLLSRTELEKRCYIILVSEASLALKVRQKQVESMVFEIRNIAVNRQTPHAEAKALARKKKSK